MMIMIMIIILTVTIIIIIFIITIIIIIHNHSPVTGGRHETAVAAAEAKGHDRLVVVAQLGELSAPGQRVPHLHHVAACRPRRQIDVDQ